MINYSPRNDQKTYGFLMILGEKKFSNSFKFS